jgi:D-inositol-3-phosphate glycosyltransferase
VRIAVISYHASPFATPGSGANGGMSVYVRNLATELARTGNEVAIFTGVDEVRGRQLVEPGLWLYGLPDDHASSDVTTRLHRFAERLLDELVRSEPFDVVHANYWLSAAVGHVAKHELGLPLAVTFHTLERAKVRHGQAPSPLTEVRSYQEQRVAGCADLIVSASRAEATWLRSLYGQPEGRLVVAEPGVEPAIFAPAGRRDIARAAIGVPSDGPVLLYVGRIQPLKGTALAVASWLALDDPSSHLVVVGGPSGDEGPAELDAARALAATAGASDRLHLVEPRPHIELGTYYRAADLTIVPSESETFGLVALESLACATPVVATRVGGLAEIVRDGISGILVDERTPEAFAGALRWLLADPERLRRLGENGARIARRRTWAHTAAELRAAIEALDGAQLANCASCA